MVLEEYKVEPFAREQAFVSLLCMSVDILVDMFFLGLEIGNDVFLVVDSLEEVGVIFEFDLFVDKLLNLLDDIGLVLPEGAGQPGMPLFLEDEGGSSVFDVVIDEQHIPVEESVDYIVFVFLLYHHVVIVKVKEQVVLFARELLVLHRVVVVRYHELMPQRLLDLHLHTTIYNTALVQITTREHTFHNHGGRAVNGT